ncbi:unnamed protein product [Somion occarium]|uniref:SH3 domain-containing protein n=1 Tax=Somion occarium TaxID=3059160 RepID=A0ABP1DEU6_9APHY
MNHVCSRRYISQTGCHGIPNGFFSFVSAFFFLLSGGGEPFLSFSFLLSSFKVYLMASSNVRHLASSRRHWAREIKHREVDSFIGSTATRAPVIARAEDAATPSVSSKPVVAPLSTSVKALTGFIVVLGVCLIGIAAWRIGIWRRKRIRARHVASSKVLASLSSFEKSAPLEVTLDRKASDKKSGFIMPAIYPVELLPLPPPAHSPNKAVKKGTNRFLGHISFSRKSTSTPTQSNYPPPSYDVAVIPPLPIQATPQPALVSKANLQVEVPARPPVTLAALTVQTGTPLSPVPSPRTSSYGAYAPDSAWKTPATSRPRSKSINGKKLPRLMVVTCTFVPSLADELKIKVGETLRLVEEYEDEWCLVQRIGKPDAEKGVIPRFCLQERPEILASLPKHKKGSSLGGSHSQSNLRY